MNNPEKWYAEAFEVKKVDESENHFGISKGDGWHFLAAKSEFNNGFKPVAGMTGTLYMTGSFGTIVGYEFDGHTVKYQTRAEYQAQCAEQRAKWELEKEANYKRNVIRWSAEVQELHPALKARIDRFIERDGFEGFFRKDQGYELFILSQATLLLKAYAHEDEIVAFDSLGYDEQFSALPGWDEGHSGNTYGCAIGIAKAVCRGESV